MTNGIVVGKFLPPHRGHHALIAEATAQCDQLTVVVVDGRGEVPSAGDRALWLQQIHPDTDVVFAADQCEHGLEPCRPECSPLWARHLDGVLGRPFDLVVSKRVIRELFAAALGARHVMFDAVRRAVPVSGTAVRADLAGHWTDLHPVVRAGLHRRVVILGAESTGTTTLATDLSRRLSLTRTVEFGRTLSWELAARAGGIEQIEWTEEHFWRVLTTQRHLEFDAAATSAATVPGPLGPWIVCDTDALATVAWWERYLSTPAAPAAAFAAASPADAYVLTDLGGVPFVQDGLRDGAHVRSDMHRRFVELLDASGRPWVLASGSPAERVEAATRFIADYEAAAPRFVTQH